MENTTHSRVRRISVMGRSCRSRRRLRRRSAQAQRQKKIETAPGARPGRDRARLHTRAGNGPGGTGSCKCPLPRRAFQSLEANKPNTSARNGRRCRARGSGKNGSRAPAPSGRAGPSSGSRGSSFVDLGQRAPARCAAALSSNSSSSRAQSLSASEAALGKRVLSKGARSRTTHRPPSKAPARASTTDRICRFSSVRVTARRA